MPWKRAAMPARWVSGYWNLLARQGNLFVPDYQSRLVEPCFIVLTVSCTSGGAKWVSALPSPHPSPSLQQQHVFSQWPKAWAINIWLHLFSLQKINSKNAFCLHLIDYMEDLIKTLREGEMTNFQVKHQIKLVHKWVWCRNLRIIIHWVLQGERVQHNLDATCEIFDLIQVASCTLDASAKIYAGRVDSIHAQAYKMLGGLGRADENAGNYHRGDCAGGGAAWSGQHSP